MNVEVPAAGYHPGNPEKVPLTLTTNHFLKRRS
jgi:hypothetical protein